MYGLRVIPGEAGYTPKIGDIQRPSKKWVNGYETDIDLLGTSAALVKKNKIEQALKDIGVIAGGQNGYYFGDTVVLIKGRKAKSGEDVGEILLKSPEIVAVYKKQSKGESNITKRVLP